MPTNDQVQENAQPQTSEPVAAQETTDWKAEAEKWRELSRKNEARAKENHEKAKAFDDLQEQSKSELQKALEAKDKSEKELKNLQLENLRMRVAAEKGVDPTFLQGEDEETMRAFADKLIQWRGAAKPKANSAETNAGVRGQAVNDVKQLTRADLKGMSPKEISAAARSGQLKDLRINDWS